MWKANHDNETEYDKEGFLELERWDYSSNIENNVHSITAAAVKSSGELYHDGVTRIYVAVHWELQDRHTEFDLGSAGKDVTEATWKQELEEVKRQIANTKTLKEFETVLEDLGFEIEY
ncbi:MAG TPA: hypothetical protein PKD00_07075 [Burkholderiales bacterium]|nr:hypothetical protein [Burkholderiales bacterium]